VLSIFWLFVIFLILSVLVHIPISLFVRENRTMRSFAILMCVAFTASIFVYILFEWAEQWQLEISNDLGEDHIVTVSNQRGGYKYTLAVPSESSKYVYISGRGFEGRKVRVCVSSERCHVAFRNCGGFGGCSRQSDFHLSETRTGDVDRYVLVWPSH